ncbi:MAG: PAS domain S-box protein [Dehalococcoidia bacterium]|nr:PAS domain S-box protein [Dehalococcoidia bacterium]
MNIFKIPNIGEALESSLDKYIVDEDRESLKEFNQNVRENQEAVTLRITRSDGDPRVLECYPKPFNYHGKPGSITFIRDITVRKMAEDQVARHPKDLIEALNDLRESEDRFRILVENLKDYSICLLDSSGDVTSWNKNVEYLEWYKREEVISKYCSILFSSEDIANGQPQTILATAAKTGIYHEQGRRTKKAAKRSVQI